MSILLYSHFSRALYFQKTTHNEGKRKKGEREREKNRGVSPTRRKSAKSDAPLTTICSSASTWRYPAVTPRVCSRKERERKREREVVFVSDPFYEEKGERRTKRGKKHPRFPRKNPETRANEKKLRVVALVSRFSSVSFPSRVHEHRARSSSALEIFKNTPRPKRVLSAYEKMKKNLRARARFLVDANIRWYLAPRILAVKNTSLAHLYS